MAIEQSIFIFALYDFIMCRRHDDYCFQTCRDFMEKIADKWIIFIIQAHFSIFAHQTIAACTMSEQRPLPLLSS